LHTTFHKNKSAPNTYWIIAGAALNFCCLCVLILFAWLREQPLFWRNAGHWPTWLRELVGTFFYPLLLVELLLLVAFTGACLRNLSPRCRTAGPEVAALPVLWTLYLLVIAIVAVNNLDNLLAGQPLHWHLD